MSLNIGDIIDGKYRIVRLLGEGGMGSVYEGENLRIHRQVAIKILHANVAASTDAVQRFEREAQAAGRIGSEHIVEVLDLGDLPDGDRYMVMEFLEGESLDQRIANQGRLPPREAAKIVIELLDGLGAAHDAEIVHRDLKPENVYLLKNKGGREDFVKIVDFGISKFNSLGGEFSMTRTGAVMGTPYYLSPEQAKGDRALDHRADLYAVGVILYEAVSGAVPFDGETFNELLFKIALEPVKPLPSVVPEVDDAFSAIVTKAMAREPDARFSSARALQKALQAWLAGDPIAITTMPDGVSNLGASEDSTAAAVPPSPEGLDNKTALGPHVASPHPIKTHGAWATTSDGDAAPRARKWILPAAAALILLSAGAFAMNRFEAAEKAEAAARAHAQEEEERERARLEKLAELEAEKKQAEEQKLAAERAKLLAEKEAVEARLTAVEQARIDEEKRRAEELAARSRPQATPRPVARPAPAPSPAPVSKPKGRKFRKDI